MAKRPFTLPTSISTSPLIRQSEERNEEGQRMKSSEGIPREKTLWWFCKVLSNSVRIDKKVVYKILISCLVLLVLSCKTTREVDKTKQSTNSNPGYFSPNNFDIYLLIGQSNMAGRAEINAEVSDTLDEVYLFTGTKWQKAANPLNIYSSVRKRADLQKLGPGYSFAKKIAHLTSKSIGLVVNARGGTKIEWWQKGYAGDNDFNLYEDAVDKVRRAAKEGKIKGIIWHQGESNQSSSSEYMEELKQLVGDLRADLNVEELYFVAGELGKWRSSSENMNNIIEQIPQEIDNADYVSTDGLTPLRGDSTDPHFDNRSQQILGQRYADKVLEKIYR